MALSPTVEKQDPNSCLNRALLNEPVFVMLARDAAGIYAVRCWIDNRVRTGKNKPGDPQITEAEYWIARAAIFHKEYSNAPR